MKRLILLNGPPRCGKNTAAKFLEASFDSDTIGYSHRLKRMVHGVYLGREGWDMDPDCFDAVKSLPQAILSGMSWRQAYIHYSEEVIKPLHGTRWFGEHHAESVRASPAELVAVPDSGFRSEAEVSIDEFGPDSLILIRIHKIGCTYEGDSRGYVDLTDRGVKCFDVENIDGDPRWMRTWVLHHASELMGLMPKRAA